MIKKLSVIMPNYNHSSYLEERLSSILAQLNQEDEIVIIDDASTDDSIEVIKKIASQDSRVRLFQNPQNLGVIKTINRAANLAQGNYLALMSADDLVLPGFVAKTMQVLEQYPEMGMCCSLYAKCFEEKIHTFPTRAKETQIFCPNTIIQAFKKTGFWIPGHTVILKKELYFKYGTLDEQLGPLCDWFLLHKVAINEGAGYIPETLAVWRQHSANYSLTLKDQKFARALIRKASLGKEKKAFGQSCLLSRHLKANLFWVILRPKYWGFLFHAVARRMIKAVNEGLHQEAFNEVLKENDALMKRLSKR